MGTMDVPIFDGSKQLTKEAVMCTQIKDLIRTGINVLTDRDLLKVTTIKKRFIDQMAKMDYGHFCDLTKVNEISHVGRTAAYVVVKNRLNYYKLDSGDWMEWRAFRYIDGPTNKVHSSALADFHGLPQLFED